MGALALYTALPISAQALITALKIILIVVFVFITSPTAIHAIVDAAVRAGLKPWSKRIITKYDLGD
jgi:multicomponent Na+:H+ antiporter subunit G